MSIGNYNIPVGLLTNGKIFMSMESLEFIEWLQGELNKREWTQAKFSKKSKISQSQITRILNGTRGIGPDTCKKIARALNLPEDDVFRQAGLLTSKPDDPPDLSEWIHLYRVAEVQDREYLLDIARALARRSKK